MEKPLIKFGDIEIKKQKPHQHKRPISIKIQTLIKQQYLIRSLLVKKGFKYFIGQKDAKKSKPLCVFPPEMKAYKEDFNEVRFMSFLIKGDKFQKNIMKFAKELKMSSKKNLIVNQYIMKNI